MWPFFWAIKVNNCFQKLGASYPVLFGWLTICVKETLASFTKYVKYTKFDDKHNILTEANVIGKILVYDLKNRYTFNFHN